MNARWYIGTLLLLFICFGAFHERVSTPNQEIVLEFSDPEIDPKDLNKTIADLREKLITIGVSNIRIQESQHSTLKISYHSVISIDRIKEVLLEESLFTFNQTPEDKEEQNASLDYTIDIYELTDETDVSKRNNLLVFDSKYNADRFTTNTHSDFLKSFKISKANQLFQIAYKAYKNDPFTKDFTSHKEPEVRAGPKHYSI